MSRKPVVGIFIAVAAILVVLTALRRGPDARTVAAQAAGGETTELTATKPSGTVLSGAMRASEAPTVGRLLGRGGNDRESAAAETSDTRTLSGRVTLLDGTALAGAVVSANSTTSATTDATGRYELTGLPRQIWGVSASHADGITSMVRRVDSEQTTLDFALRPKAAVRFVGRVIDAATRDPMPQFTVTVRDREVLKDPAKPGMFEITGVFTGDQLSFRLQGGSSLPRDVREWIPTDASGTIEREYALGTGGMVTGRVVRSRGGEPVTGVRVALGNMDRGRGDRDRGRDGEGQTSATTGQDGRFVLESLNPGQILLRLQPERPLLEAVRFAGELQHNETKDVGDLEIGEGGTIKGRLVKLPGDLPFTGVPVQLSGGFGGGGGGDRGRRGDRVTSAVVTDARGEFVFNPVVPGPYQVAAREFRLSESAIITAEETREVVLRVGSATLKGTVLKTGEPLVGAEVELSRQGGSGFPGRMFGRGTEFEVDTGEDGTFEFKDLAPGLWEVSIDPDNGRRATFTADIPEEGVVEKTFAMPSGNMVGKVVDAEDKPVSGATVSVVSGGEASDGGGGDGGRRWGGRGRGGIRSDSEGRFRMADRDPGPMVLMAHSEGFGYSDTVEGEVPDAGDSQEIVLRLGASPTGTLVSTALHLETGGAIRNAYLTLTSEKGRFSHDQRRGEDGVLTIPDLPAGSYTAEVGASGYTVSQQRVEVRAGETADIIDVLSPAGSFRLTVVDGNGVGVAGANCLLTPLEAESIEAPRQGVTSEAGVWQERGLMPGRYTASVSTADGRTASAEVTIPEGSYAIESAVIP